MKTMIKRINVINDQFTVNEAKEVLLDYISKSIKRNKIENFSSQIRLGINDEKALNRIEHLKAQLDSLSTFLKEAQLNNKTLKIKSFIEIQYVD
ncbi:hypothetical protein [Flavobacterium oreochromis]|uniref:hypothetical protein n=1 Tax=Flavobacterium oreochromis TaxID=2906078 RepID=UPI003858DDBA